jgi:hypothetical protein
MDTKQLTSKINLAKARIAQINDSTLYTEAEKLRLSEAAEQELAGYQSQLASAVNDMDVQSETL